MRQGDTADVVLRLVSTCARVALSMQMYRAWLLYTMFTDSTTF